MARTIQDELELLMQLKQKIKVFHSAGQYTATGLIEAINEDHFYIDTQTPINPMVAIPFKSVTCWEIEHDTRPKGDDD